MSKTVVQKFIDMEKSAVFSEDEKYRYALGRVWNEGGKGRCVFCMLNPSTADAMIEDPTVRRCMLFARRWGFRELHVINIFALRSTDPDRLREPGDPIGPENDEYIRRIGYEADLIVAAWGVHGSIMGRGRDVQTRLLGQRELHCLGVTGDGNPRHPLYIRGDTAPKLYRGTL